MMKTNICHEIHIYHFVLTIEVQQPVLDNILVHFSTGCPQLIANMALNNCKIITWNIFVTGVVWWAPTAMLTISKLCVTMSFLVVYIQCAEIYPTSHRGSGTGLSSLISSIFGITAPYIAFMVSA